MKIIQSKPKLVKKHGSFGWSVLGQFLSRLSLGYFLNCWPFTWCL